MDIKLFNSELKVMEVLWKEGALTAGQLAKILNEQTKWNRNTTYTIIKKLIAKGAIERYEPNFTCKAIVTKDQVQQYEIKTLIGNLFDNSTELFLSAFLNDKKLSGEEIERLKKIVEDLK